MIKTVLVLPGTLWQVPLVQKIKEMGYKAIVVNPAEDSPCFKYSDGHLQSDIFAKEDVIQYGKDNRINAVMSDECDIAMNLVAEIGEIFNIPALDRNTASLFTDKLLMRDFCKRHGLRYPEYARCCSVDEVISFFNGIKKPIIIKPLDSNASHGVFRCNNVDDIKRHFEETLSFSRVEKAVLAERYISGTEFTIDGVKTPNGHYTMAISEKKHFAHNESIANELFFTHTNPNFDYVKLRKCNDDFVLNTNLRFGFTHAEYKYEDGEFYLIEIAARGGGNLISAIICQYMTGYDTYKYLIECATGNIHNQDFSLRPEYAKKAAVLKFFSTPNGGGVVKEIRGLEFLSDNPDIKYHKLNFRVGDTIQNALNDSARIGFYIACSESEEKLREVMKNIEENFSIIVE